MLRRPTVLFLLALLLTATGCGRDAPTGDSSGPASGGFPVTITGKFGTTSIPKRPMRVVAMSWTDADLALSLGVTPVGIATAADTPNGLEPWTAAALGAAKPALFDTTNGDPLEKVAALAPDLILANRDYHLQQDYAQLSQIAPVVTYAAGPNSDSWQQNLIRSATALGLRAHAGTVIADVENGLSAQKSAHPELTGKTYSYIVAPTPSGAYTVNSAGDVSAQVLGALGMRLVPTVLGLPTSGIPGRAQISMENLNLLDADVVLAAGSTGSLADLARNPVFNDLGAVRRGAYLPLDYTAASAMAFPSPLSLQWAIANVVPKLTTAAKG